VKEKKEKKDRRPQKRTIPGRLSDGTSEDGIVKEQEKEKKGHSGPPCHLVTPSTFTPCVFD
jgi:hypothetical protein